MDAMGGDRAPGEVVRGAVWAAEELGIEPVLVGQKERIEEVLGTLGRRPRLEIMDAREVIGMDEAAMAIRRKRDSSMVRSLQLLRDGYGAAAVSAGSTGGLVAGGLLIVGRIRGIRRPVLASVLPSLKGSSLLLDMGAHTEARPEDLLQSAVMGARYAEFALGIRAPRVALVNNGTEADKGSELTKAAHSLLAASSLNFIGNIEGRDIHSGTADVLVTDGFTGNVILKHTEGLASAIFAILREELNQGLGSKLGALLLKPAFRRIKRRMDYAEYGGAPLIGINGALIKCHGSSNALAIMNGIRVARDFARGEVVRRLTDYFSEEDDHEQPEQNH